MLQHPTANSDDRRNNIGNQQIYTGSNFVLWYISAGNCKKMELGV